MKTRTASVLYLFESFGFYNGGTDAGGGGGEGGWCANGKVIGAFDTATARIRAYIPAILDENGGVI